MSFIPDGESRNKRYYPKELWERTLNDTELNERLKDRHCYGTIGHDTELNDVSLLEGKVSHIVTNLYIEDGVGIGEAEILNTEVGRTLRTILGAKCKLYVSSRGIGKFKESSKNGNKIVDPDNYLLETFDFVMDPGFLEANPTLVESIKSDLQACKLLPESTTCSMNKDNSSKEENKINNNILRGIIQCQ